MLTDLYEFSMANGYCATLPHTDQAVFDIFYRTVPDHGSFVIAAGLQQVVEALQAFHFDDADIDYLRSLNLYSETFLNELATMKLACRVTALPEGTPVFPRCPQNRKRKGLGNIIISAPLQSVYDVQIGVIGSQQNNRNSGHVFLDLPEQLKPTAIRQIDIQQDQGYTAAKQLFLRRF